VFRAILTTALALFVSVFGRVALAQDASARAAYRALTQTPPGALPATAGVSIVGSETRGWTVHARYGLMSFDNDEYVHNFGIGGDVRVGAGRVGLTLGVYEPACTDGTCPGHFMTALGFSERMVGVAMGREGSHGTLNVGLDVTAALGTPPGGTLYAGSISLPISFASDTTGFRIVPYVAPGFGTGLVRDRGDTDAGIRATFGAGVAVTGIGGGLGLNAGVQRIFLEGGNWLVGVGVSYGR
jgi:hypothetical protein